MWINGLFKNILIIFILLSSNLFLTTIVKTNNIDISNTDECYGYIIPLPSGYDTTYETFQNSKVRFLINDLLRENVEVFWSLDSFFANCKSLSEKNLFREFQKGSFVIPFEGNISKDKLISSIIIDYNISSEIDNHSMNIEAFILIEKIDLNTLKLTEPKIAQHFDIPVRYGWPCYLQIAESGGFLNFDFLLENEVLTELNSDKYNVFMWPYEPDPARLYEVVKSLSNRREFETIRSFVKEGGGFIGSCYGALAASSGFLNPLSGLHLIQAYNPLIPVLPFSFTLSISDSLMMERAEVLEDLYTSYSTIDNNTHPITFSITDTVKEFFSGPWYIWLGKNTKSISTFNNVILDDNKSVPTFIEKRVENSPSWTVSSFGKGNMVLFTSHPEFINNITFLFENRNWNSDQYYGRRVIFNSIMYVTAKKFGIIDFDTKYTYSFINELKNNTIKINITESPYNNFEDFANKLDKYENNLTKLRNQSYIHLNLYSTYFNESNLYPTKSNPLLYTYTFCNILVDYINKTRNVLDIISNIYFKFNTSNYNISNNIISLKNNISEKMNETNTIFQKSLDISNNISILFNEIENKLISKTLIIENSRKMITTFEISLKYFPQIYFESLKMLNHEWYNYESKL